MQLNNSSWFKLGLNKSPFSLDGDAFISKNQKTIIGNAIESVVSGNNGLCVFT